MWDRSLSHSHSLTLSQSHSTPPPSPRIIILSFCGSRRISTGYVDEPRLHSRSTGRPPSRSVPEGGESPTFMVIVIHDTTNSSRGPSTVADGLVNQDHWLESERDQFRAISSESPGNLHKPFFHRQRFCTWTSWSRSFSRILSFLA